jgi:hypothetical protein
VEIPASMVAQAKTFCSMQPCARFAEGELVIELDGETTTIAICPRHYEYVQAQMSKHGDTSMLSQEIVFADEMPGEQAMINDIIANGNPYDIIY